MFTQVIQHGRSIYSFPRSLFVGRSFRHELKLNNLLRSLLPTLFIVLLIELVLRHTGSGYSVIVILLLSVMVYTAYKSGALIGVLGALLVILYNFYLVSVNLDMPFLSTGTLESGGVVGIVFPVLALIIGTLKERNDALLLQEQTARLKAEDSAQQLRFMAESMPQKIFTVLPNGKSAYMNPQWEEYTGSTTDSDWSKTVHPQDLEENMELWKRSLETGEPFQFEHRLKHPSGKYVWHLTRANALRDKKGNITMWVGSSTDIETSKKTKRLEADTARLIKQRKQLMELSKAKDEFISLASHQLRTPATGVKQYINMVLDGYGGNINANVRKLLSTADASNERQLSVINDLLRVAQVDAGKVVLKKERFDIDDLLRSIIQDQQSTFVAREQTVKYERKKRKVNASADTTKLRMAIENVLDNASKYSHANTTVSVRLTSNRKTVTISIKDQGVGISKSKLTKVFDKFTRIDNERSTLVGGNGLGLYWVRKIIELHGGEISVTSVLGKGSTFVIKLPVTDE